MSDAGLDFSDLTDDQIVELASALAHEALRRTPALAAAFEQALVTEKERAEAAARGAGAAKLAALRREEELAARLRNEQEKERYRQRQRDAMATFLRAASRITQRPLHELTLVWNRDLYGRGPRVQLNAGTTGVHADWHLVDYKLSTQEIKTSPGLRSRTPELLAWARETAAGAGALNLIAIIVQGVEL